jgi:hypothetical protein
MSHAEFITSAIHPGSMSTTLAIATGTKRKFFQSFMQVKILALEWDDLASLDSLRRRILHACCQLSLMGLPAEHEAELRTLDVRDFKNQLICAMPVALLKIFDAIGFHGFVSMAFM